MRRWTSIVTIYSNRSLEFFRIQLIHTTPWVSFVLRWMSWWYTPRHSPNYSHWKRNLLYPIWTASFVSVVIYPLNMTTLSLNILCIMFKIIAFFIITLFAYLYVRVVVLLICGMHLLDCIISLGGDVWFKLV
jgi:hypothetical protein